MRICIDARYLGASRSGIAQYSENLLCALAEIDGENDYTVYVGTGLERRLRVGRNFRVVALKGGAVSTGGLVRLARFVRRDRADLLHALQPVAPPAPLDGGGPVVVTVHDALPFQPPEGRADRLGDRMRRWLVHAAAVRRARWVVCVSRATRDRLVEFFPEVFHKTIVVASGVEDFYRERTPPELRDKLVARLGLEGRYVFHSGPTWASKNVPRLVESFALLVARDPRAKDVRLAIDVTDQGEGLRALSDAVAAHGLRDRVRVLRSLSAEERRVCYEEASAFCILSKNEGFGFPALRAQLCGTPVVAADAGALPEVCGDGALLVDPDNPDETAEMLDRALFDDDLRDYLRAKGLENAGRFSWAETARNIRQIYELLF